LIVLIEVSEIEKKNKPNKYQENGMVKKALLMLLMVSVMAAGAYSGGLALSGVGSKAIGMGGAFRGLADNWSAAYWNPAGLAQLSQTEVNFMGIGINPIPQYKPTIRYGGYEVGYKNDRTRYPKGKTHLAANASGFYKIPSRDDIVFGVAMFVPYALGSSWNLFKPAYDDVSGEFPTWNHSADLKVIDIHPSIAKSFMDGKLMLGAGMSIMRGSIEFRKTLLNPTTLPRPHDFLAVDAFLKGDGWGYGANFGVLYKFSDKLQVGLSGKTPTTLKLKGDVASTLFTINNSDLENVALSQAGSQEEIDLITYIFSDEPRNWKNNASADLKLPADAGIGFAYKASKKLLLTMDLSYTLWSSLDSIIIEIDTVATGEPPPGEQTESLVIRTKWEDILRVSLGGQYQVSDRFACLFGFYYDPSPIPDETFSPLFMDIGSKYSGNLGASVNISNWELGYNFEYIHFSSRDIPEDIAAGSDFDNYPGLYKAYLIANHLSITYRF
jgi:long-chain fatty acid transport protein